MLAFFIGTSYGLISHSWSISRTFEIEEQTQFHRQENRAALRQKNVTPSSTIGYGLLAATGACCLLWPASGRLCWRSTLVWLGAAYLAWSVTSVVWATSSAVCIRKVGILALMFISITGMVRKVRLNDLAWMCIIICLSFIVLGIFAELAQGTFRPWQAGYRFSGTVHPNSQAMHAALLCIACGCLLGTQRRSRWILLGILGIGFAALVMTKSRTSLGALLAAGLVTLLLRVRGPQRILLATTAISLLCIAGIAYSFTTSATADSTLDIASMGRRENVSSLTGRLPLWKALATRAADRPFLGHGFGSFWSSKNIRKYSEMFAWSIPHAHNAYLDIVLMTGMIGLLLYLAWVLSSLGVAVIRHETTPTSGVLFAICLILFSLVHGLAESKFPSHGMGSYFLFFALVILATRPSNTITDPEEGPVEFGR